MNPLISIVVTVHNSESTLAKCLDSIITQTRYDAIELICINDRSTDDSESIVEKHNLPWIAANGEGVGAARNTGIAVAHGRYIWFVDADDELVPDSVDDQFVNTIYRHEVDLFVIGVEKHFDSKTVVAKNPTQKVFPVQLTNEGQKFPVFNQNVLNSSWNKIYNLKFIRENGNRYPQFSTGEDAIFNYKLFLAARNLMTIPIVAYRFNMFSATSSKFRWKKDQLQATKKMGELLTQVEQRTTLVDRQLLYMNLIDTLIAVECNFLYQKNNMRFGEFKRQLQMNEVKDLRKRCGQFKTKTSKGYRLKALLARKPWLAFCYIKLRFIK